MLEKLLMCHPKAILWFTILPALFNSGCNSERQTRRDEPVSIFVAISASQAIEEIVESEALRATVNAASSSVLARQIDNGAPANIFISADTQWVEWLSQRQKIEKNSMKPLLKNSIVAVSNSPNVRWPPNLDDSLKIGIADPQHVPLGRYTKEALTREKFWSKFSHSYVYGKDAHSTLRFAERDEVSLSIVYKSDTQASSAHVIHQFAETSTSSIVYPIALVSGHVTPESREIYDKIINSQVLLQRHGFQTP